MEFNIVNLCWIHQKKENFFNLNSKPSILVEFVIKNKLYISTWTIKLRKLFIQPTNFKFLLFPFKVEQFFQYWILYIWYGLTRTSFKTKKHILGGRDLIFSQSHLSIFLKCPTVYSNTVSYSMFNTILLSTWRTVLILNKFLHYVQHNRTIYTGKILKYPNVILTFILY